MPVRQNNAGEKPVLVLSVQAEGEGENNDDQMNYINEYDITPGVYVHYKGGKYVVTDLITHLENSAKGQMEKLEDPLVVYRDLERPTGIVKDKRQAIQQVYARKLSEFTALVISERHEQPVKRFTLIS
jgi:hypothetical protein